MYSAAAITDKHIAAVDNRAGFDFTRLKNLFSTAWTTFKTIVESHAEEKKSATTSEADLIRTRLSRTTERQSTCGVHPAVSTANGTSSSARLRNKQKSVIADSSMRFKKTTQQRDHFHVEEASEIWQKYNSYLKPKA